jgi:hypothetical protein
MNIKLDLTVDEVNTILRCLGRHPFDEIAALIAKVKQQGEAQILEQQKTAATENTQATATAAQ